MGTELERLVGAIGLLRAESKRRRLPRAIGTVRQAVERSQRLGPPASQSEARLANAIARIRDVSRVGRLRDRVPRVASTIRTRLSEDAHKHVPGWRRLAEGWDGRGLPVATLSACGRGTAEIRYTQLLRFYLDPRAPHGLGTRPLRALFGESLADPGAIVEAEVDLGSHVASGIQSGNQLDLLIRTRERAVLIEQKILSAEDVERDDELDTKTTQLLRYSRAFEVRFPEYRDRCEKFFLTPNATTPGADQSWRPISHRWIVERLTTLLSDVSLSATARFNLHALLWDLLLGPLAVGDALEPLAKLARDAVEDPVRLHRVRRAALNLVHPQDIDLLLHLLELCP